MGNIDQTTQFRQFRIRRPDERGPKGGDSKKGNSVAPKVVVPNSGINGGAITQSSSTSPQEIKLNNITDAARNDLIEKETHDLAIKIEDTLKYNKILQPDVISKLDYKTHQKIEGYSDTAIHDVLKMLPDIVDRPDVMDQGTSTTIPEQIMEKSEYLNNAIKFLNQANEHRKILTLPVEPGTDLANKKAFLTKKGGIATYTAKATVAKEQYRDAVAKITHIAKMQIEQKYKAGTNQGKQKTLSPKDLRYTHHMDALGAAANKEKADELEANKKIFAKRQEEANAEAKLLEEQLKADAKALDKEVTRIANLSAVRKEVSKDVTLLLNEAKLGNSSAFIETLNYKSEEQMGVLKTMIEEQGFTVMELIDGNPAKDMPGLPAQDRDLALKRYRQVSFDPQKRAKEIYDAFVEINKPSTWLEELAMQTKNRSLLAKDLFEKALYTKDISANSAHIMAIEEEFQKIAAANKRPNVSLLSIMQDGPARTAFDDIAYKIDKPLTDLANGLNRVTKMDKVSSRWLPWEEARQSSEKIKEVLDLLVTRPKKTTH